MGKREYNLSNNNKSIWNYFCICVFVYLVHNCACKPKLLKENLFFFFLDLYILEYLNPPIIEDFQLTLMTKLTTLKFDLLKTKYFNKFCLCKEIERLHSNKIPSMARCGYLLGWSKVSFGFSITSYRKTWISFLANPIYLEAKKKKKSEDHGSYLSRDCIWLKKIKQWSIYDSF